MGYRELLKKYIRFLEVHTGDNFIEVIEPAPEPMLTKRDLAELRTLASEVYRGAHGSPISAHVPNYNYRIRLLLNRFALTTAQAAALAATDEATVRRWRTSPGSARYLAVSRAEFERFESELYRWLNAGRPPFTAQLKMR